MITNACSQTTVSETDESSVVGIFVASTPCGEIARPLHQIPAEADCERIQWKLILYQDPNTLAPTTYQLNSTYGLTEQGAPGFMRGGTQVEIQGKWILVKGTNTNPEAVVYQLDPDDPQISLSFLKVDDNLLHLLYRDERLMIGNAAWSYTLSRTDH